MASKSFNKPLETRKSPLGNIIQKDMPTEKVQSKNNTLSQTSLIDSIPQKTTQKKSKRLTSFTVEQSDWEKFDEVAKEKGYSRTELLNIFIKNSIEKK
ncbi:MULTISPECIES: hypothetical protein [unclassified Lactococcus]|uniref:hypothetical protein n=1 Tax=unclassified Lactococcus TaxID=2643510 RepID=UPI0011CB8DC6|nr:MULTISPECIES: hypothetical protein [unclassified Lactococcus]MQW24029.1 hypothetical protein [Lactococcus sp. dk101]TXK36408.1 hypothetical protein FVP42_11390 [Lactococcus sp. dk310]TXK46983.1 hypothetical protein FVP43_10625 [Lactococcus sp. dk322]